jgi:hypothetical protein
MTLSPQEKWAKEKERQRLISEGKDPDQTVIREVGSSETNFKKPGEPCSHPPGRIVTEEGRTLGSVRICLDCGCIVNDPDAKG